MSRSWSRFVFSTLLGETPLILEPICDALVFPYRETLPSQLDSTRLLITNALTFLSVHLIPPAPLEKGVG